MALDTVTFGCRLNLVESEAMRRAAEAGGLADAVLVNSCAVTAEAVRQARQAIRRARRDRPEARIVVSGCAAQIAPDSFAAMPEVDLVLGNVEKLRPESYRDPIGTLVGDIFDRAVTPPPAIERIEGHSRGFVQVQMGCDHRCTFCVIPFGRGASRSVPAEAVIRAVRRFVEAGASEVVLTGVDITSYGGDIGGPRLGVLVQRVLAAVPELPRLRLSSIDSVEADEALIEAFASEARLMPQLHLSLQAGDDLILKRMKRRHARADAIRFCDRLRRLRPDIVFGADLIAGFPTETEEQFRGSLDLVEACHLVKLHVFPFSPRPGTPAARMPQVPGAVIKARAERLRAVGASALANHLAGEVGRVRAVLAERGGTGHTEHFLPVALPKDVPPGALRPMRITGHDGTRLEAVAA